MMSFTALTPHELGESKSEDAIPYLAQYLKNGDYQEKRLAASAITKLASLFPKACTFTYPYLIHNLSSDKAQVRQYTLKALNSLPIEELIISDGDVALLKKIREEDPKEYNRSIAEELHVKWERKTVSSVQVDEVAKNCFPEGATKKVIEEAELAEPLTSIELVKDEEHDAFYFRSLESKGIKLNKPQLEATRHFKGPSLVLAGAGSGKTRVLSSRAGHLISVHNVNPRNILLLTFTRKAADEMKERIALLPGLTNRIVRDITSGTYHSIFLGILRSNGESRKVLAIEKAKHVFLKMIMKEMGLKDDYEPESLLSVLSHYKNNMVSVDEMPARSPIEKEVKEILEKYEDKKHANGLMDFDDILLDAYLLLKHNDDLRKSLQSQFTYILCDEWQDTNPVQYELIKMLALPENNLFVVGDDDQTIYEFNGADSAIILNFSNEYPKTKAYQLDINYRSTTSIVGLANKVISFNEKRYQKTLQAAKERNNPPYFMRPKDANEEAGMIVENIINDVKQGNRKYKDFSVLYRSNSNSRAIFDELVLKDIPFVTYGDSNTFYEQAIVKPVIDYLRLAVDGKNIDAAKGILPSLYLNQEKAFEFIMMKELMKPAKLLLLHLLEMSHLKDFQRQQIFERIKLIRMMKDLTPIAAVQAIRRFYDKYLETDGRKNLTMHKEMVQDSLSEIESSASRFRTIQSFVGFVDEIIRKNKEMEDLRKDPKADVVKLMTIHKSKGLEFPVVYLIGASENILPHRSSLDANSKDDIIIKAKEKTGAAIEGERRLAYVAITRAEEELYISSPRIHRDENVEISRFIMDVYANKKEESKKTVVIKDTNNATNKAKTPKVVNTTKETVLVWDCTSDQCNAWSRIRTYEETLIETKSCPLCGSRMVHGVKEV